MDIIAYVFSSLAILWMGGGGNYSEVFPLRSWIASVIIVGVAFLLVRSRKELATLKPNSGSWMMGVGLGVAFTLIALILTWLLKNHPIEIAEFKNTSFAGILTWVLFISPACEIIYRKYLAVQWGHKSSAFVEALNFGVGAVNFYIFAFVFLWGYFASKVAMKFGIVAAIVARSLATLFLFICLKTFF